VGRVNVTLVWIYAVLGGLGAGRLHATETVDEIARIHIEAIGGPERIAALRSVRAAGHVTTNGTSVRFTMIAARPACVRVETGSGGRTLVQGTDGVEPPWEFDTGAWPPRYRPMADNIARVFSADAEFDDPIVAGPARGFTLEPAGEVEADGRKVLRVLVTYKLTSTFFLLLDPVTYFIVQRIETRATVTGRKTEFVTRYNDFLPVDGVLLPHEITVSRDGRLMQQTWIEVMDPNLDVQPETFSRPKISVPGIRK
jgi:hypothetical protein